MDRKTFFLAVLIIILVSGIASAAYNAYRHSSFTIGDGKDIDLNGQAIGNGTFNYSTAFVTGQKIGNIIYVGNGGYSTIAAGLTAANNFDKIIITSGTYNETSLTPKSNITIECQGSTLNNSNHSATAFFRHVDDTAGLKNFNLRNCVFTGGNVWYSRGNFKDSTFENNVFNGGDDTFITFFDGFAENNNLTIKNNKYQGLSAGWDMMGGQWNDSKILDNSWYDGNAQAIGCTNCNRNILSNNYFSHVGNVIGLEGNTQLNIISNNFISYGGNIKLGLVGGIDVSAYNIVNGNSLNYGGGIEVGNGNSEMIVNNHIYASTNSGIFGIFNDSTIQNNLLIETNTVNGVLTVNGGNVADGGITLFNSSVLSIKRNLVSNNKIYSSFANFNTPSGTKQSYAGQIAIEKNNSNTIISGNDLRDTYGKLLDYGTATIQVNNMGISPFFYGKSSAIPNLGVTGAGDTYYDTDLNNLCIYNGTSWLEVKDMTTACS